MSSIFLNDIKETGNNTYKRTNADSHAFTSGTLFIIYFHQKIYLTWAYVSLQQNQVLLVKLSGFTEIRELLKINNQIDQKLQQ